MVINGQDKINLFFKQFVNKILWLVGSIEIRSIKEVLVPNQTGFCHRML